MSVLGTNRNSVTMLFSRRPGIIISEITLTPSRFRPLLTITVLHGVTRLDTKTIVQ